MTVRRPAAVVRMVAGTAYGRRRAAILTAELEEVVLAERQRRHTEVEATGAGRRRPGRMDWFGAIADTPGAVVIEIKNTDWDAMASHRVAPNARRHARQLWRYLDSPEVAPKTDEEFAQLFIEYPRAPSTPGRREQVEAILNDNWITVVWVDE